MLSRARREERQRVGVRDAGPQVASVSCHCPVTMLGNLRAWNPVPTPLPHTQGPLDKDLTEWEGPRAGLRAPDTGSFWDPNPQILGPHPSIPQAPPRACRSLLLQPPHQRGRRRGCPSAAERSAPSLSAPSPREVTLRSHAPARVSRWPCPSTPASSNPATRSPRPLRPSHCPAPADKAPDTPTERSPPPDLGPPARSRACPRQARGLVPRHPGRVLGECARPEGASGPGAGARAGGDRPGLGGSGAHHPGAATAAAAAAAAGRSRTGQWGWPDKGPPRLPPQAGPPPPPPPPLARPQRPPSQAFAPLPFPCSSPPLVPLPSPNSRPFPGPLHPRPLPRPPLLAPAPPPSPLSSPGPSPPPARPGPAPLLP